MRAPSFWYRDRVSIAALLLAPLAPVWLVGCWLRGRLTRTGSSGLPVVCIGNLTVGGTGKTPLVAALAYAARARGWSPVVLTRGHGGALKGPVTVTSEMSAWEIGDEARMLGATVPVVVARNRADGARFIEARNLGDLILMDDGMQSHRLAKDRQVAVFSGRLGYGNGLPVPAGPLRERLAGIGRADAVVVTGEDLAGVADRIRRRFAGIPVFHAGRRLHGRDIKGLKGRPVVAFAGIGDPDGFFDMLKEAGVRIAESVALADHEPLTERRVSQLRDTARKHRALLATTEKDAARMDPSLSDGNGRIHSIRLETKLDEGFFDLVLPARERGA